MPNTKRTALSPAEPAGYSVQAIEAIADHFRKVFSLEVGGDVHVLAESLDCTIAVVDPEQRRLDVQGTLEVRGPADWTVYLPQHTGPLQDRFTLAHELGHYVLHAKFGEIPLSAFRTFSSNETPSTAEVEADAFALALLMPCDEFTQAAKKYDYAPDLLAAVFSVDRSVAEVRLRSLGLPPN